MDYINTIFGDLATGRAPFYLMVCRCSRRTMEEQKILGSYCLECWKVINKHKECADCKVSMTRERLYVSTDKEKPPRCQKCYLLDLNPSIPVDTSTIQEATLNVE